MRADLCYNPALLFLGIFVSLVFFLLGVSLAFLSAICLFSKVLRVREARQTHDVFEGFLGILQKIRKRRTGNCEDVSSRKAAPLSQHLLFGVRLAYPTKSR